MMPLPGYTAVELCVRRQWTGQSCATLSIALCSRSKAHVPMPMKAPEETWMASHCARLATFANLMHFTRPSLLSGSRPGTHGYCRGLKAFINLLTSRTSLNAGV